MGAQVAAAVRVTARSHSAVEPGEQPLPRASLRTQLRGGSSQLRNRVNQKGAVEATVLAAAQALVDGNAFVTVQQVYCGLLPPTEPPEDLEDEWEEAAAAEEEPVAPIEDAPTAEDVDE